MSAVRWPRGPLEWLVGGGVAAATLVAFFQCHPKLVGTLCKAIHSKFDSAGESAYCIARRWGKLFTFLCLFSWRFYTWKLMT